MFSQACLFRLFIEICPAVLARNNKQTLTHVSTFIYVVNAEVRIYNIHNNTSELDLKSPYVRVNSMYIL